MSGYALDTSFARSDSAPELGIELSIDDSYIDVILIEDAHRVDGPSCNRLALEITG